MHVDDNNLELYQSAYKKHHSTETALLKVQDDILRAIDNNCCVILLLLDLSAAFDCRSLYSIRPVRYHGVSY